MREEKKAAPADDVGPKEAVAYLDIGEGGYLDLGSDLSDEALRKLPKGRHMLAIVGTYGVDGYVPVAAPTIQAAQPAYAEMPDERAAFEALARAEWRWPDEFFWRHSQAGEYTREPAMSAWIAWQAALRASHGQAPVRAAQKYDDTLVPFLALMRRELHANSSKGDRPGWLSMRPDQCLLEIYWHAAKLSAAVKNGDQALIAEHAADVANMAMMQADIAGLLSLPTAQPAPVAQGDALTEIVGCLDAANVEGLDDALVNNTDARLADLVQRRLLPAFYVAIAAQAKEGGA